MHMSHGDVCEVFWGDLTFGNIAVLVVQYIS